MTQCPYTDELYRNEDKSITVGRYESTLIGSGQACACCIIDELNKVAYNLGLDDLTEYNVMEDGKGTVAVTLGLKQIDNEEMWYYLHKLYDQDVACMHCEMSRSMDEYHGKTPRVAEKVTLEDNQIIAYGSVVTLMTYDQAKKGILWYLEKTGDQGEAMLADIGYSGYEIVLRHVKIGDTHYAGDSDYISVEDAQRLVDEGLADYMQFE